MTDGHLQGRQKLRAAAARGLRPQAPVVLPGLCPQGAGGGGSRRPSGRAGPAGAARVCGPRPDAQPRTASGKQTQGAAPAKHGRIPAPLPASPAKRPPQACGSASPGQLRASPGLGPWRAAEEEQNFSPSRPEGPGSSILGAERRGLKPAAQGQRAGVQARSAHPGPGPPAARGPPGAAETAFAGAEASRASWPGRVPRSTPANARALESQNYPRARRSQDSRVKDRRPERRPEAGGRAAPPQPPARALASYSLK